MVYEQKTYPSTRHEPLLVLTESNIFYPGSVTLKDIMRGSRKLFFSHQSISERAVQTSLERQLDPTGPIASWGGGGGGCLYLYF